MSKRWFCLFLALCLMLCQTPASLSQTLFAKVLTSGKYEYSLSGGGACIVRYTGRAKKLELPKLLGGFPVVAIGDKAFAKAKPLKRITVPDTVKSIAQTAFAAKRSVTLVAPPGSYTEKFVSGYAGKAKLKFASLYELRELSIGEDFTLQAGETQKLRVTLAPANADPVFITYLSGNPDIAVVSQDGTATALRAGKVRITATNLNGVSDRLTITVKGEAEPPDAGSFPEEAFFESGEELNREIAHQASCFAFAANTKRMLLQAIKNGGFTLKTLDNYGDPAKGDYVAYSISSRSISSGGQSATLYLLTLRGTQDLQEWLSNMYIGTSGTHQGFSNACDEVEKALKSDLKDEKGPYKLFVAGHSRGSAVGNLLCARLINSDFIDEDDLFAYLFAPPAVSTKVDASLGIHNFYNEDDIVPRVPLSDWGYAINGEHNLLRRSDAIFGRAANLYYLGTGHEYNPVPRALWNKILSKLAAACPTAEKYDALYKIMLHKYRPRIGMIFKYAQNGQYVRMAREAVSLVKDIIKNSGAQLAAQGVDLGLLQEAGESFDPSDFGFYNPISAHEMPIYCAWMTAARK